MLFRNFKKEVGIDVVNISRFEQFTEDKSHHFLQKIFTSYELDYCFLHEDAAPHLAGIFAAKEAISKALGTENFPFICIEIRHRKDGKPDGYKDGERLSVSVSIAHTSTIATAVAIA